MSRFRAEYITFFTHRRKRYQMDPAGRWNRAFWKRMPHAACRPCLFVYGTLKRGFANPWSCRLWSQAVFLGAATVPGRLYDLGAFPALVETADGESVVHGELAELASARLLEELDDYEGPQYERVQRRARLEDGTEREAWVYVWRAPLGRARPVAGGRWPVE